MLNLITHDQVEKFHKNGYVILKKIFNDKELDDFKQSLLCLVKNTLKKASDKYYHISTNEFDGLELDDVIIKL